ncbi:MAG TPA: amylo-alpha-1,6-glucosidase [Chloroflexota bacterium]|nr:amylo-alpha-1,6-glucosidase [Chloroflexota bacterium]
MTDIAPPSGQLDPIASCPIHLTSDEMAGRTFLLGNEGGFVLYLPVRQNIRDRTLQPTKWFGASGFGRAYLEDNLVWLARDGDAIRLDRSNQTGFTLYMDHAVRAFSIDGLTVTQTFFMPNRIDAFAMTIELEGDDPAGLTVAIEPEYDMRYYQALNETFDGYAAEVVKRRGRPCLRVTNRVRGPTAEVGELRFYSLVGADGPISVTLLPTEERLRPKTYLTDEKRHKLIERAYVETHEQVPDEAPIWDQFETTAYAPARISGPVPLTLVYTFGDRPREATQALYRCIGRLPELRRRKHAETVKRVAQGDLVTGVREVDVAYRHVLIEFNNCLVARNVRFHGDSGEHDHFNAIFAGNKYFLDAWKRDENISLIALLVTGDYGTVRDILRDTWSYQDRRTGRLPHIIRLGEPLVYYSSDGTLWALVRLDDYTRRSGDTALLDEKYPMVERFFTASLDFVKRGLLPSGGIIDKSYLWETWEDTPYTPRDGYPVEIELLWLTALQRFLPTIADRNPELARCLGDTLAEGLETFRSFELGDHLADSLSYHWEPRDLLTPNGYIAFGLDFPLPSELARTMVLLAREQLAGEVGVRSLAPRDWPKVLSAAFLDDPRNIRNHHMASVGLYNYHRGIEWLWLNQFMVAGELAHGDAEHAYRLYLRGQVDAAQARAGVGGLGELYDLHGPLGADFQAWSMASLISGLHRFAGVAIDAIQRKVTVRPSPPADWQELTTRNLAGKTRFDVRCRRDGEHRQEVIVEPVDRVPSGYSLRVGVRLPKSGAVHASINGQEIPAESIQVSGGDTGSPREAWIETPFRSKATLLFEI